MFVYRNLSAARGNGPQWQYGDKPKQPVKANGKPAKFAEILAFGVSFKLSEASRLRCLRQLAEGKGKGWDVHAYARAIEVKDAVTDGSVARPSGVGVPITYDKFGTGRFVRKDTGAAIEYCAYVFFAADGHTYAYGYIR